MARVRTVRSLGVVGLVLVAAVTAGCSGSSSGPPAASHASSGSGSGSATTAGAGAAPAPTESNPPGDIPDNQAYVAFRPSGGAFTVKVPEGWARTGQGGATVFTDKLNRVEIATASASSAPTVTSVGSEVVPRLRGQVPKFDGPKVSQVNRHAGSAVLLKYQGDSAADPVTGKIVRDAFERYAFYRQGHEVDLTLSGPVNADNVDPWRIVTDSFSWK
ncbi:hypothetical protein SAMN05446589_1320 [Streptomyces sp. OV198]|uniref:hypothetical protein n=1 Tax=Streptomyces sp. OV198 TaxID=1882787 RepID=UPI000BD72B86|nr:hypothetical protein [Streptomyces sp. OV198]SOE58148.1 hypothetical protein SAMN05446589_1320 [Streptomyces sp. OV198]